MVSRPRLMISITMLPLIIIMAAFFFAGGRKTSLTQALNEYITTGNLRTDDNRLLSNIARDFAKGTKFEDKIVVNAPPLLDSINIYVLGSAPKNSKQYFRGLDCNCAYVGQQNVIVCDSRLLEHFRHLIDIPTDSIPSIEGINASSIINYTNLRFSYFLLQWIIGHEMGHLILGHSDSNYYFQSSTSSTQPPAKMERQHELDADKFVIEHLSVSQSDDQFWGWLALSNVISNMYAQAWDEQSKISQIPSTGNETANTIELADSPDVHPPWLIRSLDMATLLSSIAPYATDRSGYFEAVRQSIHIVPNGSPPHTLCDVKLSPTSDPALLTTSPTGDYRGFVQKGFEYWKLTEYDAAITEFTQGIDSMVALVQQGYQPPQELLEAYLQRGVIYFVQEKYEQAIADWEAAVSIQPQDTRPYNNLGFAYYELGQLDEAIIQWQAAISLEASVPSEHLSTDDSWAGLGIAYYKKGQTDEAIAAYKKALEIEPNYASLEWMRYERSWSEKSLSDAAKLLALIKP